MMSLLKEKVLKLPELEDMTPETLITIQLLITQFEKDSTNQLQHQQQFVEKYTKQFQNLFKTFNNSSKISLLRDENHRALVIAYVKSEGVQHYKYSYFNRAKLTKGHIERMKQVGPILFSQAVMIASKINIINKNNSRLFIQDHLYTESQSPIDMKIQEILKLCDQKKRNVNNNLKKLQLILEGPDYLQIIKQLGKMLRDSWKKDKSKTKIQDVVKVPFKGTINQFKQIPIQQADVQQDEQNIDCFETIQIPESDILSFTSSQKQIIKQHRQQVKRYINPTLLQMSEFDQSESIFKIGSLFSDKNSLYQSNQFI